MFNLIEEHRLKELIHQEIQTYPNSSAAGIYQCIGQFPAQKKVKATIYQMVDAKKLVFNGESKWRRYSIFKIPSKNSIKCVDIIPTYWFLAHFN